MKPVIYPYKLNSGSARDLAKALGTIRVRENGTYSPRKNHLIVNWGNPRAPTWATKDMYDCVLNAWWKTPGLTTAQNKLGTFRTLDKLEVPCVEWTTNAEMATLWLKKGSTVVQRNTLTSHSGHGITIIGYDEETSTPIGILSKAPLYTQYKKKANEFRVHVMGGTVIDVQEKRKVKDFQGEFNQLIRSHDNGWIFAREDIVEPEDLRPLALTAINALGLDFGACDIIYNKHENKCFMLEINTAPGIEGTTLTNYVNAIKSLC